MEYQTTLSFVAQLLVNSSKNEEHVNNFTLGNNNVTYRVITGELKKPIPISSFDKVVSGSRREIYLLKDKLNIFIYDRVKKNYSLCFFKTKKEAKHIFNMYLLNLGTNDKLNIL